MLAEPSLSASDLVHVWPQLALDETLPDRYELTEHGERVTSPKPTNRHQRVRTEIALQLRSQLGGEAVTEAAVLTRDAGVRVPAVSWMPGERWAVVNSGAGLLQAPDLVVEVLSPGNRRAEVAHMVQAFLASGIREVLVVELDGKLVFHRPDGTHESPALGFELDLPGDLFA